MPIYTLCSTDCNGYNEIIATVPFYNSERMVDVTVLSFCTLWNVEILGADDFMDISVGGLVHRVMAYPVCNIQVGLEQYLDSRLDASGLPNMKTQLTGLNTLDFVYSQEFTILNMTYNFKLVTGFYYLNGKNNFPIVAKQIAENEFRIQAKASPFTTSTPVLYILSNTGGNCYRMNLDQDTLQTGTICMIINNAFMAGGPAIHQQADITTRVYSSDLTFMRFTLCDCNLRPLRILNPIFITMSINEVSEV
jgi:hypothetical protein